MKISSNPPRCSPIVAMWPDKKRLRSWFLEKPVQQAMDEMRRDIPESWGSTHGEDAAKMPFSLSVYR
jgi:hypothetical protein